MNQWIFSTSFETVHELLWPTRNEWYNLGIALKVHLDILASIKKSNLSNCDDCFYDMLKSCSETNTSLTWSGLCEALRTPAVDHNYVAEDIEAMIRTKQKRSHHYSDGGSVASDNEEILRNDGNSEEGLKSESDA